MTILIWKYSIVENKSKLISGGTMMTKVTLYSLSKLDTQNAHFKVQGPSWKRWVCDIIRGTMDKRGTMGRQM